MSFHDGHLLTLNPIQPATVTNPPEDWTVDPEEMQNDIFWGAVGEGTLAAKGVGLDSPQPLMIKSREAGGDGYVFMSGGKVYLWNMLQDDVWEYVKPVDLEGILAEMRKPAGTGSVEVKQMKQVS
ncbi:uncharacterized protein PG998_003075 [Apiospora kogelbergensis]|uniref:Uncharacterized protein n=1 Tax=Apiospora kogelbergensis TaxID=1337665 RepID=A0AAW0QTK8_9PEZI